ncbi:hypothetical protein [Thermococcus sp.]
MEEGKVLLKYYAFTVPNVSILAGSVLGVLFVLGVRGEFALGLFALIYGIMLLIIHVIVYPQFRRELLYKLGLLGSLLLTGIGVFLLLRALRGFF